MDCLAAFLNAVLCVPGQPCLTLTQGKREGVRVIVGVAVTACVLQFLQRCFPAPACDLERLIVLVGLFILLHGWCGLLQLQTSNLVK